jgi:hypothetical protein
VNTPAPTLNAVRQTRIVSNWRGAVNSWRRGLVESGSSWTLRAGALPVRTLLARYACAWLYLAVFVAAELAYAALPVHDQAAVAQWASTNVVNLRHDPVGSLVASAFVPAASAGVWPVLIALALFGANRALGNWRTAVVCVAGHVLGSLVSEGIVDYRVAHGWLPVSDTRILDVGPSYIVVSAIAVAVLYGSWPARVAAAADFAALVFVGRIFSGLTSLDVAAVGHLTAITVAVVLGCLLGPASKLVRPAPHRERPPVGQ